MGHALEGRRVLVADDEPLIAMLLSQELSAAGAQVIGPACTLDGAWALLADELPGAAVLDVKLGEQFTYSLADELIDRQVPFVFATGWGKEAIPERYALVPVCAKPFSSNCVTAALEEEEGRVRGG